MAERIRRKLFENLDHENLMEVEKSWSDGRDFYQLMRSFQGKPLLPFLLELKPEEITVKLLKSIVKQLLEAVLYLKNNGIILRDLKPQNVLVYLPPGAEDPEVKVTDYFLETDFAMEMIKNLYGTRYFQAPEVIENQYDVDCPLWNLGVIMYLIFLGRVPFPGDSVAEVMKNIERSEEAYEFQPADLLPEDAADIIDQIFMTDQFIRVLPIDIYNSEWLLTSEQEGDEKQLNPLKIHKLLRKFQALIALESDICCYVTYKYKEEKRREKITKLFSEDFTEETIRSSLERGNESIADFTFLQMKNDLNDKIGDKESVAEWITCQETTYFRNRMQASLQEAENCEALPNSESVMNVFLRIPKITQV